MGLVVGNTYTLFSEVELAGDRHIIMRKDKPISSLERDRNTIVDVNLGHFTVRDARGAEGTLAWGSHRQLFFHTWDPFGYATSNVPDRGGRAGLPAWQDWLGDLPDDYELPDDLTPSLPFDFGERGIQALSEAGSARHPSGIRNDRHKVFESRFDTVFSGIPGGTSEVAGMKSYSDGLMELMRAFADYPLVLRSASQGDVMVFLHSVGAASIPTHMVSLVSAGMQEFTFQHFLIHGVHRFPGVASNDIGPTILGYGDHAHSGGAGGYTSFWRQGGIHTAKNPPDFGGTVGGSDAPFTALGSREKGWNFGCFIKKPKIVNGVAEPGDFYTSEMGAGMSVLDRTRQVVEVQYRFDNVASDLSYLTKVMPQMRQQFVQSTTDAGKFVMSGLGFPAALTYDHEGDLRFQHWEFPTDITEVYVPTKPGRLDSDGVRQIEQPWKMPHEERRQVTITVERTGQLAGRDELVTQAVQGGSVTLLHTPAVPRREYLRGKVLYATEALMRGHLPYVIDGRLWQLVRAEQTAPREWTAEFERNA